jgi:hypothetical protein
VQNQPFPTASAEAVDGETGGLGNAWYYLLQTLWRRLGGAGPSLSPVEVTPTGSVFLYDTDISGTLVIEGGTVSEISIIRSAQNIVTGMIAGAIPMMRGDAVSVTYAVAPTMTFLPSEKIGSSEAN